MLILISCSREDDEIIGPNDSANPNDVRLLIRPQFGGENMKNQNQLAYTDTSSILFKKLFFYLSPLNLVNQQGDTIFSRDVVSLLFEANYTTDADIERGVGLSLGELPAGNYTLSTGIGLTADLNSMSPSDFDVRHPLSDGANYWMPWASYIFTKHEGVYYDPEGNVTNFVYHTGSTPCYKERSQGLNMGDTDSDIVLTIDFKEVFKTDTGMFHIPNEPTLHRLSQTDLALFFCEQMDGAMSISVE